MQGQSHGLHQGLPHGHRGPGTWIIFGCFPRLICRELVWKGSSWDSDWCSYGMLVWQPAVSSFQRVPVWGLGCFASNTFPGDFTCQCVWDSSRRWPKCLSPSGFWLPPSLGLHVAVMWWVSQWVTNLCLSVWLYLLNQSINWKKFYLSIPFSMDCLKFPRILYLSP